MHVNGVARYTYTPMTRRRRRRSDRPRHAPRRRPARRTWSDPIILLAEPRHSSPGVENLLVDEAGVDLVVHRRAASHPRRAQFGLACSPGASSGAADRSSPTRPMPWGAEAGARRAPCEVESLQGSIARFGALSRGSPRVARREPDWTGCVRVIFDGRLHRPRRLVPSDLRRGAAHVDATDTPARTSHLPRRRAYR